MVNEAVRLQPDAGETLLAQAIHRYFVYDDRKKAAEFLTRALAKLPNDSKGWSLLGLIDRAEGRWDDALRNQRRASTLDPTNIASLDQLSTTNLLMRRYAERTALQARIATLSEPPQRWVYELRGADAEVERTGDVRSLRLTWEKIIREDPAAERDYFVQTFRWVIAENERDSAAMESSLSQNSNPSEFKSVIEWARRKVLFNIFRGDRKAIVQVCEGLIPDLEIASAKKVGSVRDATYSEALGWFYAALGRRDDALRVGLQILEQNSIRRNAVRGTTSIQNLAEIYCLLGETDRAIEQLEVLTSIPSGMSYGQLKLDLIWDPLRGNPRFQKLLEKMAPKDSPP